MTRIGASEISAIIGQSEYATPFSVWARKLGKFEPSEKPNAAIERGNYFEDYVRARYELETGLSLLPLTAEHDSYEFVSCSFDGIDTNEKILVEIKIPKREVIDAAEKGILPEELQAIAEKWKIVDFCKGGLIHPTYYPQIQYQLMIAGEGYKGVFLVGEYENINGRDRIVKIHKVFVEQDPEFQKYLLLEAVGFKVFLDKGIQPPLTDRDTMELTSESAVSLFKRLKEAKAALELDKKNKELKAAFEEVKEEAIDYCEIEVRHCNVECEGISFSKNKRGVWSIRKV